MSRNNGPISPLSMNSNDSFASRYGSMNGSAGGGLGGTPNDIPYNGGPYGSSRPMRGSPPVSSHPSSSTDMSRPSASSGSQRPPSSTSSIGGRSDGRMGFGGRPPASRDSGRSTFKPDHEDALQRHYQVLRTYLASHLRDEKGNLKPNRARDKLLRLSVTQFMELSTDVYDELIRREDDRLQRVKQVPPFLQPKPNYHPKRNQARQKLSTLPIERFKQLATDVFFELERRIPRFAAGDIDRPISTSSNGRAPSRGGMRPPPPGFRGPPPPGGPPGRPPIGPPNGMGPPQPPYQSFRSNSSGSNGIPPSVTGPSPDLGSRRPSEVASEAGGLGRPLPKTFQSNTIVPNKSTMVEDDDSDDDEEEPFPMNKVVSGISSARFSEAPSSALGGGSEKDSEMIKTQEAEITKLKDQVESLENRLLERESEVETAKASGKEREESLIAERDEWFNLREQLEQKVMDMQNLHDNMRNELEMLKRNKSADEEDLHAQHDRDLEGLRNELDSVHGEKEHFQNQLGSIDNEKERLQNELESIQDEKEHLQDQLDNLRRQNADMELQLETSHAEVEELRQQAHNTSLNRSVGSEDQERRIQLLEEELATQEKLTNEVRQEATMYIREMRDLSRQNDAVIEQEEKLAAQVAKLEKENDEWRQRYAKVKAQNKSLRASTLGLNLQTAFDSGSLIRKEGLISQDGLVKDVDITQFQIAVDELLRAARQPTTEPMIEGVKQVTICVQSITSNVGTDGYPTPAPSPHSPNGVQLESSVARLKARVTGTANSLITATKQHASASGLSPVALLDAAASNLTASVVELIKAVGIRPSSKEELHEADLHVHSFYDDSLSPTVDRYPFEISVPVPQQPPQPEQTENSKPAPLTLARTDTASSSAGTTKKGWFAGWGRSNSFDESPSTPTMPTHGLMNKAEEDDEEDEHDHYR